MTTLVLLILGAVWAAVLVPPALRARAQSHPGDSIGSFHHQLSILRRTGGQVPARDRGALGRRPATPPGGPAVRSRRAGAPVAPPAPVRMSVAQKRRRDVLITLLWIMGATLVLGLVPAFRSLLYLHVVADLLFAGYVVLLVRMRQESEARRARELAKVTRLRERQRTGTPGVADLALRRAANN